MLVISEYFVCFQHNVLQCHENTRFLYLLKIRNVNYQHGEHKHVVTFQVCQSYSYFKSINKQKDFDRNYKFLSASPNRVIFICVFIDFVPLFTQVGR